MMGVRAMRGVALCMFAFVNLISADSACSGSTTISKASALSEAFARCTGGTYTGDIHVQDVTIPQPTAIPTSGNFGQQAAPSITLSSLVAVESGSLLFSGIKVDANPNQVSDLRNTGAQAANEIPFGIVLPVLESVGNTLGFSSMRNLNLENFPKLGSVGNISFSGLTLSNTKEFSAAQAQFLTKLGAVNVMGTNMRSIGPFSAGLTAQYTPQTAFITASDNRDLSSIDMGFIGTTSDPDGFSKTEIHIKNNNRNLAVTLANTESAYLDLEGVSSLTVPALVSLVAGEVSSTHMITGNYFRNLDLSKVTTIEDSLVISDNANLRTVNLQALNQVTSRLEMNNNPQLKSASLSNSMSGQVDVNASPNFNCGSVNLPSNQFDCDTSSSTSLPTTSPVTSSSSGSSGLSTGAKAGIGVGVGLGALLVVGAIIFLCCRRRRRTKSYSTREISSESYSKSQHSYTESGEMAYSKVPFNPGGEAGGVSEPHSEEHTPTSALAHDWSPPEREVPSAQDSVELEEQQGMRHEMDARSLPDMDSEDDEEADTRSLEDIERIHRER